MAKFYTGLTEYVTLSRYHAKLVNHQHRFAQAYNLSVKYISYVLFKIRVLFPTIIVLK